MLYFDEYFTQFPGESMPPIKKKWQIATRISPTADEALNQYPFVMRQILFNRGYATSENASAFIQAVKPYGTDPHNLSNIDKAVERIIWAIKKNESIVIYGDYDVDGVTATALLVENLNILGAKVSGYIPNRFDEGYGLNIEALDNIKADGVSLVITVDCGVRSTQEVNHAQHIGLDLIITDHHQPSQEIPEAFAIINPKLPGDQYPDKDLAGVGLAYKLAAILFHDINNTNIFGYQYRELNEKILDRSLDLVSLGTVADLAPLVGENRALVRSGLEHIRDPHRQGIQALIGISGLNRQKIMASDIGFIIGPRLNAAGRLESALAALDLLLTDDIGIAVELAQKLDNQNRDRQIITRDLLKLAEEITCPDKSDSSIIIATHPDFNPGVVGLVASRLVDKYYKPSIVASIGEKFTRGSCRSIPEFHITEALDQCTDIMEHHGGHAAAAGFTIKNENLPELIERLQTIAHKQLSGLELQPTIHADMEISLTELQPDLLNCLDWLQPTGYGNPPALFVTRNLSVKRYRLVGHEDGHLKLTVSDGRITYDAIAFRQGHWSINMPNRLDLAYTFEKNIFNGQEYLQLNVKDIIPTGSH